jgi:glutamate dehydrogenase/leucine dehydrogenase
VLAKLQAKMESAADAVCDMSKEHNVTLRDAAYMTALSRIATAYKEKGM